MYALIGLQGDINTDCSVTDKIDDIRHKGIFPKIYIHIYFNALTQTENSRNNKLIIIKCTSDSFYNYS